MYQIKQVLSPNRHVIAAFTYVTLLPLVYYIPPWLVYHVTDNRFVVTLLSLAIIVPVVSYVALPLLFKSFEMLNEKKDANLPPTSLSCTKSVTIAQKT